MRKTPKAVGRWILGQLSALAARPSRRIVVLCYHSVHDRVPFASATRSLFDEHLAWLREHCDVIPFDAVSRLAKGSQKLARPAVAITFDDGYADNYDYALPLLRQYALPATFFITVGFVERDPHVMQRFDRLRPASRSDIAPLTWKQIAEIRAAGMELGSHTWSHPNLARVHEAVARFELLFSKQILEEKLEAPVSVFAFPFGKPERHFTARTLEIARESGYAAGAATVSRAVTPWDDPLRIPRIIVTMDSTDVLQRKVFGDYDGFGWWHDHAPPWIARLVSPQDFAVQ